MEKIVISPADVAETQAPADQPARMEPKLPSAVPRWAKWALAPLVLLLPVLCLVAIVLRVAMRGLPPRTRHEWTSLLATLLIVSGMVTTVATVLILSVAPLPSMAGAGLSELDEQSFPSLPAAAPMSAKEVSEKLKPLVAVISPATRSWLTHAEMPTASFGAGTLLQDSAEGYLFVTARHVLDGPSWNVAKAGSRALIAMASGTWGTADVRFTYNLRGLYVSGSGEIMERDSHVLEVNLTLGYPRRAPQCRMLTPIFHPNFDDSMVCIGDFWAASEGLDDLIIRIGRMIAYQEYNTKSPLNGLAAKWAAQNSHLLPIDPRPVAPPFKDALLMPTLQTEEPSVPPQPAVAVPAAIADPWSQKIVVASEN